MRVTLTGYRFIGSRDGLGISGAVCIFRRWRNRRRLLRRDPSSHISWRQTKQVAKSSRPCDALERNHCLVPGLEHVLSLRYVFHEHFPKVRNLLVVPKAAVAIYLRKDREYDQSSS